MEKILSNLGLDEAQTRVFTELQKNGPGTVMDIATRTGMKRPTAHFYIEQLLAKKLVIEELRSGRRTIAACEYDVLQNLVKLQIAEAENTSALLTDMLEEIDVLSDIDRANSVAFSIEEGVDAILSVYRDIQRFSEVFSYFNMHIGQKVSEIRALAFGHRPKLQMAFFECGPEGPAVEMKAFAWYTFRHSQMTIHGPVVNVLAYGRKVSILSCFGHGRFRVLTIEQPALAEVMKTLLQK